ncbi:MAG TPA: HAMP domain-containing methyl-accepting chemotaxis protein [Vicinamibacterales bacterium]|nr:HAMP domain-containing methyl-accepting chemotaxis protein [Vicinamibacterales bacterium]
MRSKNLKIRSRLLITLAVVAVMLAAGTVMGLWSVRTVDQQARQLVHKDAQMAGAAAQFALHVAELVRYERTFFLDDAPRSREAMAQLQNWRAAYGQALQRLTEIDGLATAEDEQVAAKSLRAALARYEREFETARENAQGGSFMAADPTGPEAKAMRAAVDQLQQQSSAFFVRYRARMAEGGAEVERGIRRAYIGIAVALVLAFLVLAPFMKLFVHGPILSEAGALVRVCDAVSVGDLTSRVPDPGQSELGMVGRSLNTMLDNTVALVQSREERDAMQAAIMKLLDEVSGVADGDLTSEAEVSADMTGALADSFNFMIAELRAIIGRVQGATQHVTRSLGELQSFTTALAGGTEAQASQAIEASAAIEEMATSINQVSENASSSAAVAEQARTNAEQGARAVSRTIEGMKAVREQVQETAKRIKRLGESSQEIGEIVELIGDIADRTSILALNASIQAAMAGEAGRGFGVVAEEVERLADRATEATKKAAMLVKTTQSETAEVMAAMEDTTREVVNRSAIANEAGTALAEIQGVSNRLAELIQAISDAAQQQARGSQQIARSMNEMSAVTKTTATSTKETAVAIGSLATLADDLNKSVARFKLPTNGNGKGSAIPNVPRPAGAARSMESASR